MPAKADTGVGIIKEFQPLIFLLGGLFSLGVIYGTLKSSITKLELFDIDSKAIHKELNEEGIKRHEKGLSVTEEKFKELRELMRDHKSKAEITNEKVIRIETTQKIVKDDIRIMKNLLIEMNKNKNKGH